ncbi:hypothetical protein AXF42_Ash004613 [Apostasia shenzhenica]|uniref:RING-CH-type domain-containing protein n=1 Tax=Apostasia shenzhenica TaxID=1088818 RepID=A0A2I0BH51_9ASPA|nr:hypothetical protein AXF42_Ash004613 [Apostasia shenzhenica]
MNSGSRKEGRAAEASSDVGEVRIVPPRRDVSAGEASVVIDLGLDGRGFGGGDVAMAKGGEEQEERMCRVCHSGSDCTSQCGELISLGCSCRNDLGIAHRSCAERWFAVRGSRHCEICGHIAENVSVVVFRRFVIERIGRVNSSRANRIMERYGPSSTARASATSFPRLVRH